jgi:hypothetical protein
MLWFGWSEAGRVGHRECCAVHVQTFLLWITVVRSTGVIKEERNAGETRARTIAFMEVEVVPSQICEDRHVKVHVLDPPLIQPDAATLHHACCSAAVYHSSHNLLHLKHSGSGSQLRNPASCPTVCETRAFIREVKQNGHGQERQRKHSSTACCNKLIGEGDLRVRT